MDSFLFQDISFKLKTQCKYNRKNKAKSRYVLIIVFYYLFDMIFYDSKVKRACDSLYCEHTMRVNVEK